LSMHVKSLDHIHIYAADPELSASFYAEHFGAKPIAKNINVNGDARLLLALGGQVVVIGGLPGGSAHTESPGPGDGTDPHGVGIAHFGLRVENLEVALAELSDSDVRLLSEPVREQSGLSYAYIAAPDGVVIELTQYDSPPSSAT
jgi:catechol 2,3-dioxygenase-like lactoylglutathione lyase family enzyme